MKYNGGNIITDEDITLTNKQHFGEKLSDVLGELSADTEKLKSNVKWIYKYGGVGGVGGGSGSGSSSTGGYSIFASLDGKAMNNQIIPVDGEGDYQLIIRIQRPGGAKYRVSYSYTKIQNGQSQKVSKSVILDVDNNYEYTANVSLNCNGTLIITSIDNVEGVTIQVTANYVTNPYSFNVNFTSDGQAVSEEWFITNAQNLTFNVNYDIAIQAQVNYKIRLNLGGDYGIVETEDYSITDKKGTLSFLLRELAEQSGWTISEDNAGTYTVDFIATIIQNGIEQIITKSATITLVPQGLYLVVKPSFGSIYTNNNIEEQNMFNIGSPINFNIKPYLGSIQNNSITIFYKFNDSDELSITGNLRQLSSIIYTPSTEGIHTLQIRAVYTSTNIYPSDGSFKTYYFGVKKGQTNLTWFQEGRETIRQYYLSSDYTPQFKQLYKLTNGNFYNNTVNHDPVTISGLNDTVDLLNKNIILSLGIKYSNLNLEDTIILKAFDSQNNEILSIKQNEVSIGKYQLKYYLPQKTTEEISQQSFNYNLVNIVFRQVKVVGTTYSYEVVLYIDGKIEGTLQSYITNIPPISSIQILPANELINFIEVGYCSLAETSVGSREYIIQPEDIQAYRYYLMYKQQCGVSLSDSSDIELMDTLSEMVIDNNGDSYCEETTALHIANLVDMPVLLFTIDDKNKDAKQKLDQGGYGENSVLPKYQVSAKWHRNGLGLKEFTSINIPFGNANFYIEPQGSSTLGYKCKNYTLSLENEDEGSNDVYLFSPNFNKEDYSTFLPESSFILKADIVDSSHSNNTAIGKFVNTVTNPFDTKNQKAFGAKYIKNCLEGFPILVFIKFVQSDTDQKCYYQGLYNFNLGRTSHFNLGYKETSLFYDQTGNCKLQNADSNFIFHSITIDEDQFKPGLIVTEVQGNSPYFDFSQYHDSILYKQTDQDITYMFDDFVRGQGITEVEAKQIIKQFVQHTSKAGGYLFGPNVLKKAFSSDLSENCGYKDGYSAQLEDGTPKNQVPNYRYQFQRHSTDNSYTQYGDIESDAQLVDLQDYVLKDEENGYNSYINFRSLSEYYTICMALGLVDSVQKNLNLKTWNAKDNNRPTMYCAFYDMDTALGKNNAGLKVNYNAFSDYWVTKDTVDQNNKNIYIPSIPIIYRDFSPVGDGVDTSGFYDTPSSYLFAVAKYAQLVYSNNEDILAFSPQALWAKWRGQNGELRSADYFINTYFANNLGKLQAPLISLNYRNKYLVLRDSNSGQFNELDWMKFHGTSIDETREWLNGRFHILDAYFNIGDNYPEYIQYYNEDGEYVNIPSTNNTDKTFPDVIKNYLIDLKANKDVIVLQDLFAKEEQNSASPGNIVLEVKANSLMPVYVSSANIKQKYLLDKDKIYKLTLQINGTQSYSFGGSVNWKYLNSINPFLQNKDSISLSSNYLENLTGSGNQIINITHDVSKNSIDLPAVKSISLTGQNYYGSFIVDNTMFRALNTLDVSNTGINLTVNNSNCVNFNIGRMHSDSVNIINCKLIKSINFGQKGYKIAATTINNCTIAPVGLRSCSSYSLDSGGLYIDGTAIKNLTLSNIEKSESGQYSRVSISNDSTLQTVTLQGFSSINIDNCPNLHTIEIVETTQGDVLQSLKLSNVGNRIKEENGSAEFRLNGSDPGVIDLNKFQDIKVIKISNCDYFTKLIIPNIQDHVINLYDEAFINNNNFQQIVPYTEGEDNTICKTLLNIYGIGVFEGCPKFTFNFNDENKLNIKVDKRCTSLNRTFRCITGSFGALKASDAKWFIENCIPEDNIITSITNMFEGQNITIDKGNFEQGKDLIDMSIFHLVSDVSSCFKNTNITMWYPELFNFGQDSNILFTSQYMPDSGGSFATINVFKNVYLKLSSFHVTTDTQIMKITDENGQYLSQFKLLDLFNPQDTLDGEGNVIYPTISALIYMDFTNDVVDFDKFFYTFNKIERIDHFMGNLSRDISSVLNFEVDYLRPLKNLQLVRNSFAFNNINDPIDLYNFCSWSSLIGNPFKREDESTLDINQEDFYLYKYITVENLNKLGDLLLDNNKLVGLNNLFKNCYIIGSDPICFTKQNNNIINLSNMFNNACSITNEGDWSNPDNYTYINIDPNFFDAFPNVQILYGAFSNAMLLNPICDDFFKKKKNDDTYKKEISDLRRCFYNTKWHKDARWYHGTVEDHPSDIYGTDDYQPVYIPQQNILGIGTNNQYSLLNFTIDPLCVDQIFVAPDIFYGITPNCKIDRCFAVEYNQKEALCGQLPKSLFKDNKNINIKNVFENLNIIPYHAANRMITYNNEEVVNRIYCYVPSDFIENPSLNNGAFTFNLNLPSQVLNASDLGIDSFYLMNTKSISSNTIIIDSSSFPNRIADGNLAVQLQELGINSHDIDYAIHYNIIINLEDGSFDEGFDLNKFKVLQIGSLVSSNTSQFIYGRLFKTGTTWNDIIKRKINDSSNVISLNTFTSISRNFILPDIVANSDYSENNLISWHEGLNLQVYKEQIDGYEQSRLEEITNAYKTIKVGNTESSPYIEIV